MAVRVATGYTSTRARYSFARRIRSPAAFWRTPSVTSSMRWPGGSGIRSAPGGSGVRSADPPSPPSHASAKSSASNEFCRSTFCAAFSRCSGEGVSTFSIRSISLSFFLIFLLFFPASAGPPPPTAAAPPEAGTAGTITFLPLPFFFSSAGRNSAGSSSIPSALIIPSAPVNFLFSATSPYVMTFPFATMRTPSPPSRSRPTASTTSRT
mmetsp:Transcript_22853/g.45704  ORF Transcript_22853/g.45704 Transcript_22853/m.45704 type:complete len:209 (-) Transcript_22853:217-843(-)